MISENFEDKMSWEEKDAEKIVERAEFAKQLSVLIDADTDKEGEIYDLLQERQGNLDFDSFGDILGYNYNSDIYFIDLPNKKTIYYEIGGTHASVVESVEILSPYEAKQKKQIISVALDVIDITSDVFNNGGDAEKKQALQNLSFLKEQVNLAEDWLKRNYEKGEQKKD